jgi:hypothetical protein
MLLIHFLSYSMNTERWKQVKKEAIGQGYYFKGNIRTLSVSELTRYALELIFSTRRQSPTVDNVVDQGKIKKAAERSAPPRDPLRGPTPLKV